LLVTRYGAGWQKEASAIDDIDDKFAICDRRVTNGKACGMTQTRIESQFSFLSVFSNGGGGGKNEPANAATRKGYEEIGKFGENYRVSIFTIFTDFNASRGKQCYKSGI
jgi:hypothetical protein